MVRAEATGDGKVNLEDMDARKHYSKEVIDEVERQVRLLMKKLKEVAK